MDAALVKGIIETVLTWVGFGVVCGLTAKLLLPGRDPGGTVITTFLGMGGALIGGALFSFVTGDRIRDLISPLGFAVAILGATVLLISHRFLSGRIVTGGDQDLHIREVVVPAPKYARRRRRTSNADAPDLD